MQDNRPSVRAKFHDHPVIPSKRLGVKDGKGFLEETLYYEENAAAREKVEREYQLSAKVEEFPDIDQNTWAFWCKRAVESGCAELVGGKFPKIDEAKAMKSFFVPEVESHADKLTKAIERQTEVFEKLLAKLS